MPPHHAYSMEVSVLHLNFTLLHTDYSAHISRPVCPPPPPVRTAFVVTAAPEVMAAIAAGTGGIVTCPSAQEMLSVVQSAFGRVTGSRSTTARAWLDLLAAQPSTWLLVRPRHPHGRCPSHIRMEAALVNLHPDTASHVDVFLREVEDTTVKRDGFRVVLLTTDVGMWQHIVWRLFLYPSSLQWCIPLLGMLHCCGAWTFALWSMFVGILLFPVAALLDVSSCMISFLISGGGVEARDPYTIYIAWWKYCDWPRSPLD